MPLITQRILRGLTPFADADMTPATRERPDKIILGVKPGHRPANKPPVRIFLGTERKQFRAERTFIWSVEKHRDPSRIYEIHLLKGLKGYISGFWITGFTNYRFAIPYFCDYQGRAIYNDVDQVWLTDPAELFDRDMHDAGFLSINDHDSSVMLIDCKRMAGVWSRENVTGRGTTRKRIEARARAAGLWGSMPGKYNARDAEHVPGESACVHFTTLHTQPWRPFPHAFVYHNNPTGPLWFNLENEANEARFLPVSALRPSAEWPDARLAISSLPDGPELIRLLGPREDGLDVADSRRVENLLEKVPDADLPWVLNRLFRYSRRLELTLREPLRIRKARPRRGLHFWTEQLRLAGQLNPNTRWRLLRHVGGRRQVLRGGPLEAGAIGVLQGLSESADRQARTLARALGDASGRPVEAVRIAGGRIGAWWTGRLRRRLPDQARPEILVAAGRSGATLARRLATWLEHPPALVLTGQRAGTVPEHAGATVSLAHHELPPHPNRIVTRLGTGDANQPSIPGDSSNDAVEPGGRHALMLFGRNPHRGWTDDELRLAMANGREWAERRGARLRIRVAPEAQTSVAGLRELAGPGADVDQLNAGDAERCQAVLVAGGDRERFRRTLTASRPTWLLPWLPPRRGLVARMAEAVARRAFRPDYNKRGSIRPQQGRTYLCARLIETGRMVPPRGLEALQQRLVADGLAAWIGSDAIPSRRYRDETESICREVLRRIDPAGHARSGETRSERA